MGKAGGHAAANRRECVIDPYSKVAANPGAPPFRMAAGSVTQRAEKSPFFASTFQKQEIRTDRKGGITIRRTPTVK